MPTAQIYGETVDEVAGGVQVVRDVVAGNIVKTVGRRGPSILERNHDGRRWRVGEVYALIARREEAAPKECIGEARESARGKCRFEDPPLGHEGTALVPRMSVSTEG